MKRRLFLVDAHAYLHRAYHALPPLNNSKGEPVAALYGFARMLIQLLKKEKPDFLAVCFDTPGPTFRHKAYEAYKATRKELDGDLISQLGRAVAVAEALGFTCVELPGYEADDIMATLATRAKKDGLEAVIVTGDKDALQMVSPGIRVLKDVTNGVWMDPPQIEEKLGIPPKQVIDYLSIVGDAADNVPGVKGIGPVGAVKLLKKYGTLSKALAAAKAKDAFLTPKLIESLLAAEEAIPAWQALITLDCDSPVKIAPADCKLPDPEPEPGQIKHVFEKLEGKAPVSAPSEEPISKPSRPSPVPVSSGATAVMEREAPAVAASEVAFSELRAALLKAPAFTLSALKSPATLVDGSKAHLAFGLPDGRTALLDEAATKAAKADVQKLLSGKALKSVYGVKDAEYALKELGLEAKGPWFDAQLAQYCLNPVRPKADVFPAGDWKGPLLVRAAKAAGFEDLTSRMKAAGVLALYEDMELPLVECLREMEEAGVAVDGAYLHKLSVDFEADATQIQREIDKLAGAPINVNSPKQLGELLFDKLQLRVVHKTAKGGRSTDEEALQELSAEHPLPAKILQFREVSKLKSTYVDALLDRLDATGRVHTRFEQTGAETGRLSSVHPNLQNIPIRSEAGQRIRRAFIAPKGTLLVSADYSQIDLRVLAHESGDKVLRDSFAKNEDIHTRTASEVFGVKPQDVDKEMRRRAKAINFGIVYGQTAFGLAAQLGIPQREAAEIIKAYFARYEGVSRWIEKNLEDARAHGVVRTFFGRLRHLPELAAKNTAVRQFGERAARNTPIQGGSADIIKLAMLRVREGLAAGKFKAKMLLQIHDELLFEVPTAEVPAFAAWARKTMEGAAKLDVPLVVDAKAGKNWQDMEPLAR